MSIDEHLAAEEAELQRARLHVGGCADDDDTGAAILFKVTFCSTTERLS